MKKIIICFVVFLICILCVGCGSKQGIIKSVSTSDCEQILISNYGGQATKQISGTISISIDEKYDGSNLKIVLKFREGRMYSTTLYSETKEVSKEYSFSFNKTVDFVPGEVVKGDTKDFSLYIYDGDKLLGTYKFNIGFKTV